MRPSVTDWRVTSARPADVAACELCLHADAGLGMGLDSSRKDPNVIAKYPDDNGLVVLVAM